MSDKPIIGLQLAGVPLELHTRIANSIRNKHHVEVAETNLPDQRALDLATTAEFAAILSAVCDVIVLGILSAERLLRRQTSDADKDAVTIEASLEALGCGGGKEVELFIRGEIDKAEMTISTNTVQCQLRLLAGEGLTIIDGRVTRSGGSKDQGTT